MEIELKLVCKHNAVEAFEALVMPLFHEKNIDVEKSELNLFNEYYDTPDEFFGQRQMGFRVRAKNHQFEQTIKTKGQVVGGLHQRPEYNVPLKDAKPDLSLFEPDIWAEPIDYQTINSQLVGLFSTDFKRTTF